MKKTLINSLIAVLIIAMVGTMIVACDLEGFFGIPEEPNEPGITDPTKPEDTKPEAPKADKTALEAELALAITAQGDYTAESYNAYVEKLAAARSLAEDKAATQADVDAACTALTEARLALVVRSVAEAEGAVKEFRMISGDSKEITLADYVNDNGLSKITYEVRVGNAVLTKTDIVDGKFTLTADEVIEETEVIVAISVSYDGEEKLVVELKVKITNDTAPVLKKEEIVNKLDIFDLADKESLVLDFAENVDNAGNLELTYSAKLGDEELTLDGALYTHSLGSYTESYAYTTFTVTVAYTANGEEGTLEYTYQLGLKDTSKYNVANGNFENGLDGWTMTNLNGELPFGAITDAPTFWKEGYPMFNEGNYFSGEGASEASHGTLASPYFVARGQYATYMLGAAKDKEVYVTIENEAGEILAIFRNTKFADLPGGDYTIEDYREMIGSTVFALNFVTYKVDISEYKDQKIRFVLHDHASKDFGFACFDELITHYGPEDLIPENAVLAENQLANRNAVNAELALEITEQGDYTLDSYEKYRAAVEEAKALIENVAVTQADLDRVTASMKELRTALEIRPIVEVEGTNKTFALISGNSKEIVLADYINDNDLSDIIYIIRANNGFVTLSEPADGKFTITASEVEAATEAVVTITVTYKDEIKLIVELNINITNDLAPTVFNEEVVKNLDMYELSNKKDIILDLSDNVDNAGNLALTYSVNGEAVEGSNYTFTFGTYNDIVTYEVLNVTVSFVANGEAQSITYTYKLAIVDSTACRLVNGGFENDLEGWTVVGNIGSVSSEKTYWVEAIEFGMDGEKMFSAYAPGSEERLVGTLTSSTFKVGGSGFVTFKIGAMRDSNYVYVDVVDASTKQILARYYNGLFVEDDFCGNKLVAYKANLSEFAGREVFFRISDNADSDYGLFFADSFVTYYENEPEGFNDATPVGYGVSGTIYDVFNGGFEMGDVQGWWNIGEIGVVTNATHYWDGLPEQLYNKDGEYLFTGVGSHGPDTLREGNRGTLTSSVFEIGGTGWISFKLGGGENTLCYVQVIDAVTNEVLVRYHQQAMKEGALIQYVADLSAYIGRTVRVQVVDYATGGWGCVSFDNLITYYAVAETLPEGIVAINMFHGVSEVTNGSFENGLDGWNMNITAAGDHNTLGWVESSEHDAGWYTKNDDRKDGNNLFTFCRPDGTNCENTMGTLESSIFTLKKDSYVSFKFGAANARRVWIELVRADGEVIARFYNDAPGKINTEMHSYYYQYKGETVDCFFRVVDNSTSDYGCFVVDAFRANLESAPEGYIEAIQ